MKSDPKSGMHCDAYRIVVALPEREELMSSRGGRGELPARSHKSVQQSAIAPVGIFQLESCLTAEVGIWYNARVFNLVVKP